MLKCIDVYTYLCYPFLKKILEISDKKHVNFITKLLIKIVKINIFLILT